MAKQNKFGTFGGVFVPSILTILGVIMYLRLPMIVGEAGLWATLGIILVAHIISATTGLSVSSIATDKKVEAGGTYFMISRSLGLPIGGTLGLALFVGLSFSVSLYLIGFSESFLGYWGFATDINNIRLTGTIVLLAVTILTFISTSLAIKTQYFILVAILLSLGSIIIGNHDHVPAESILPVATTAVPLMVLFGIFFPAVTGFEAGVSMSGDLKDPKNSIPTGSILAIIVGFVVYVGMALFLYFTIDANTLATDANVLLNIALIPELVIAGIWGATLSSALGSILGAPRILQATAADRITHKIFAKGFGPTNEPRNALLLTFVIAEIGILIGELDVIARVVSIFFITTYGFLNISAAFERWTSADFRPEFKISPWISFIGALACILVMIQLDFVAMIGAIFILGLLFLYLKRQELSLDSGDAWSGVWASMVKSGLTNLKQKKLHKRNWRPNIIQFTGNPLIKQPMTDIGKALSGKLGILSTFELVKGQDQTRHKPLSEYQKENDGSGYFQYKLNCLDVYTEMDQIARVYGFSGVEPNTILAGWTQRDPKEQYIQLLENFNRYGYNTILLNYDNQRMFGNQKTIDIWWSGTGRNLALAVHLIRHISNSKMWKMAEVRLCILLSIDQDAEQAYKATESIIEHFREEIEIKLIINDNDSLSPEEHIINESKNTDLVILGIPEEKHQHLKRHIDEIDEILKGIGSALVINASDDFESFNILTDPKTLNQWNLNNGEFGSFELPEIRWSSYAEVANDIAKVNENGLKMLAHFHKKTISPIVNNNLSILEELDERVDQMSQEITKVFDIPDVYRKTKAANNLNISVLFSINHFIDTQVVKNSLPKLAESLKQGLTWYDNKLLEEFRLFPSKLKVLHNIEDFKVQAKDSFRLKVLKSVKKINHSLFGIPLHLTIDYRKLVGHYQYGSRQLFALHYFEKFQSEQAAFYDRLRKLTNQISTFLNKIEHASAANKSTWDYQSALKELTNQIQSEMDTQHQMSTIYLGRLQFEFRKNLQIMSDDMEQVSVKTHVSQNILNKKTILSAQENLKNFAATYEPMAYTKVNLILMELAVNTVQNRSEELLDDLQIKIEQVIKVKVIQPLNGLKKLTDDEKEFAQLQQVKLNENLENDVMQMFSDTIDKMYTLTEQMPEHFEIYSLKKVTDGQVETITIPVARMAEYYLKTQYELPGEDRLKALTESIQRSILTVKDHLNLAYFSLINSEKKLNKSEREAVVKDCTTRIDAEKNAVLEKVKVYQNESKKHLKEVFEPLNTIKIEESASEFIYGLRNYQGAKVLTGAGQLVNRVESFFRNIIVQILYSQSKGILFTKKLTGQKKIQSTNSKMLDLVEKVSQKKSIINALPPYYVTLFSGKSNISEEFWIDRVQEEDQLRKAVKRYKEGFLGGILVLGERNTGKTAFCKHAVQHIVRGQKTYAVFPPLQGTNTVAGFNQALRNATQYEGTTDQIMSKLDPGSIIVINDLELFWERSEEGLAVIQLVKKLIDLYSHRILFIVNLNPHTYKVLHELTGFGSHFIEIISFVPFSAIEIKELVIRRHQSSGLKLSYKKGASSLNEVQLATLFNSYFNYSEGTPGAALSGWLNNITKVSGDTLYIDKPVFPSYASIKELSQDSSMLLIQFVLHKRMNFKKIERVTGWETPQIKSQILTLQRAGILVEKSNGIYHIDSNLLPFLIKSFKEREML